MPRPTIGRWSTYTVLGLLGYLTGSIGVGVISAVAGGGLAERAIAIVSPPLGFWFAVSVARAMLGFEQIVFYQAAFAAWFVPMAIAIVSGRAGWQVSDLVIILIATFNAFGRVGCYHVACCHGRPARFGVRYGHEHARLGFPQRWIDRALFPIQLLEAAASAALAIICAVLVITATPGTATAVFVEGYALVRFALELARGDSGRPYWHGLSEAQWIALASAGAVAIGCRDLGSIAGASALGLAGLAVAIRSRRVVLRQPRHLDELERAHAMRTACVTSRGLEVSTHELDDQTIDIVWRHPNLSLHAARGLAADLFARPDVVAGSRPGVFHVIVPASALTSR